jgi:hypothetical protein
MALILRQLVVEELCEPLQLLWLRFLKTTLEFRENSFTCA